MPQLVLNTLALDPNRWTPEKRAYHPLGSLLSPIAEAGFHGVELWQYHVSREHEAAVARLREQAEALGLRMPIVGMYPRLHLHGPARQEAWDEVQRVFAYAALLGAAIVKIFVGSKGTRQHTDAEYNRALAFLIDMTTLAASHGLTITGETHPDTLFDSLGACRRVLDAVQSDHLKICFQPYDFADTPQALADYEALHRHVVHVHFQGRRAGALTHLEDADLDYETFTGSLAAHRFDGYLCLELVKDCVVDNATDFDLDLVLKNAQRDRDFVLRAAERWGMTLSV